MEHFLQTGTNTFQDTETQIIFTNIKVINKKPALQQSGFLYVGEPMEYSKMSVAFRIAFNLLI